MKEVNTSNHEVTLLLLLSFSPASFSFPPYRFFPPLPAGTFMGLCRLMTHARTFDEAMDMGEEGHSNKVNMTVGDIYGGRDYEGIGLDKDLTAAFFGKMTMKEGAVPGDDVSDGDITKALTIMVAQNVTQIA